MTKPVQNAPLPNPEGAEPNPYPDTKMGNRLREQGAAAVKEHDRKMTDDSGRVHHSGPGK